jgi:hypothetical protein
MAVADHLADLVGFSDVGRLEAEHFHDGIARGRRHVRVFLKLAGDVLAEIVGGPSRRLPSPRS